MYKVNEEIVNKLKQLNDLSGGTAGDRELAKFVPISYMTVKRLRDANFDLEKYKATMSAKYEERTQYEGEYKEIVERLDKIIELLGAGRKKASTPNLYNAFVASQLEGTSQDEMNIADAARKWRELKQMYPNKEEFERVVKEIIYNKD